MNLNINKDDSQINDFIFCWEIFGKRPNKITLHQAYLTESFKEKLKSFEEENTFTEILPSDEEFIINERVFLKVNQNIFMSYVSLDKTEENSISTDVYFLFKEKEDSLKIEEIINSLSECVVDYEEDEVLKLNTLVINNGALDIEPIDTNFDIENIEFFYNKETINSVNKLTKSIKNQKFGLNVLYGERGTGKTSVIKYLSSKVDNVVIYIPNSLIDMTINNPEFSKFLRRFHNPVLVIDDCEILLNDFFSKSNIISSNILQMVDGLNSMNINIITIFNSQIDDIDSNLLESNSLINLIQFNNLDENEIEVLCNHLGVKNKYKNKTRLIDIIRKDKKDNTYKIGFL